MLNKLKVVFESLNYITMKACSENVQALCLSIFITDSSEILESCFLIIIASALLWKESSLSDWVLAS